MAVEEPPVDRSPGGRLDERILGTLQGLGGKVAFSGLRRVLGAHPESLSRALRRLEREGLVERDGEGYRILAPSPSLDPTSADDLRSIARVELPPALTMQALVGRLTARWFGSLRWVGIIERPNARLLAWARRDGSGLVLLRVEGRSLEVYVPEGPAGGDPADAEEAAYELLFHAVEAVRSAPTGNGGGVSTYREPATRPDAWAGDN